jgi:hypothetical protein
VGVGVDIPDNHVIVCVLCARGTRGRAFLDLALFVSVVQFILLMICDVTDLKLNFFPDVSFLLRDCYYGIAITGLSTTGRALRGYYGTVIAP